MKSYFRPEIDAMAGYVPGEQPKMADLVKLNTNENPFPPSPEVEKVLRAFDCSRLRRYPDPMADALRDAFASRWGVKRANVIAGNGSDDLLTMIFRAFSAPDRPVAVLEPSYSLYQELAAMQGAPVIRIALELQNALGIRTLDKLPVSFVLSWYEQKTIAVFLALLTLGFKNIRLGPTFPAFFSPGIIDVLTKDYGVKPITTAEADAADMMAGN